MASYINPKGTSPSPNDGKRTGPRYEKWNRDDLYHLAKMRGIEERAQMSTDELIEALRTHP
ncbi:hypothetical protein TH25_22150 [Thalassospira profundimaris]|uniref:Rho termination factor N-terminal domain-containing protein n=1 Tax=Thalassospira profundimaris TaxID=502049 RepID=A0A367WR83_9PROT|nr:hypothetical protein [Thalassospira profundimaris]RCK43140.1 hypothetical protein TH25_22150 [Thalassospira profundimaris]